MTVKNMTKVKVKIDKVKVKIMTEIKSQNYIKSLFTLTLLVNYDILSRNFYLNSQN